MSSQGDERSEELELARHCMSGNSEALAKLNADYLQPVLHLLIRRGVEPALAREVIECLWGDCVVKKAGQLAILERFTARSSLRTWLFRIALNRALDRRRATRRLSYAVPLRPDDCVDSMLRDSPVPGRPPEPDLLVLLRESLQAGFAACSPEDLLKLRLVFLQGLTQRELSRLWRCHEATISRDVQRCLQAIAKHTLAEVQRRDACLTLSWEDFVELCDAGPLDFL